ncbi:MAG: hypothetical protein J3K34DRAFT_403912 [Monoraphidium minutum]|nr:MAG: hypothetical protein J3K34DRAFT_403912 [Monoraphidium minutum]
MAVGLAVAISMTSCSQTTEVSSTTKLCAASCAARTLGVKNGCSKLCLEHVIGSQATSLEQIATTSNSYLVCVAFQPPRHHHHPTALQARASFLERAHSVLVTGFPLVASMHSVRPALQGRFPISTSAHVLQTNVRPTTSRAPRRVSARHQAPAILPTARAARLSTAAERPVTTEAALTHALATLLQQQGSLRPACARCGVM